MHMAAEKLSRLESAVKAALGDDFLHSKTTYNELSVFVPRNHIREIMHKLRDDSAAAMTQLTDICGADYPERPERFEIVYHLLSHKFNWRLRIKIAVGEETTIPSVVSVYNSAGWYEREVWDMFGVPFASNPDMRRILTDYGFEGHPLRKDFPLGGRVEFRYDGEKRRVVYEPIKLMQDYRSFDFLSPWEGSK